MEVVREGMAGAPEVEQARGWLRGLDDLGDEKLRNGGPLYLTAGDSQCRRRRAGFRRLGVCSAIRPAVRSPR